MNVTDLMIRHGIERLIYVPASDLLPKAEFHAWRFDNHLECGIGATVEEAIFDAAQLREAA